MIKDRSNERDEPYQIPPQECMFCHRKTHQMSFQFGYGSRFDGGNVCWDCAGEIDKAILYADLYKED